MAKRLVFFVTHQIDSYKREEFFDFTWYPGLAISQKQKSIRALHSAIQQKHPNAKILEISSKSEMALGRELSAFNLSFYPKNYTQKVSVEVAFQASKVFENGGPFIDILSKSSFEAKKDTRLRNSGKLIGFNFFGEKWPLTPTTIFYDWLYMTALDTNPQLSNAVLKYNCFTDIEFNHEKSLNCQARTVALYVSIMYKKQSTVLKTKDSFINFFIKNNIKTLLLPEDSTPKSKKIQEQYLLL